MLQQSRPLSVPDAIAIVARARLHATLLNLNDQDIAELECEIGALVDIARAGYGTSVPAKWERERFANRMIVELRKGNVGILNGPEAQPVLMDLGFLDFGSDSASNAWQSTEHEAEWRASPDQAADDMQAALQRLKKSGFYGRTVGPDGKRMSNASGRKSDMARREVIADAIAIFENGTERSATCSPGSPAMSFISVILDAAGYRKAGLRYAMAQVLAILRNTDAVLDKWSRDKACS